MRKFIAFSFIILVLGLFSSYALAQSENQSAQDECSFLKDEKSYKQLYGLCIAYQNADENGQADIIRLWDQRVSELPDDVKPPKMPNRSAEIVYFDCPCWDELDTNQLCEMGNREPEFIGNSGSVWVEDYSLDPPGIDIFSVYLFYELDPAIGDNVLVGGRCEHWTFSPEFVLKSETFGDAERAANCMAELEVMAAVDLCD